MGRKSNSRKENCLLQLFDSAISFDRNQVIGLIQKSPSEFGGNTGKNIQKQLFKGYSRASKMPGAEVEKRFRRIASTKDGMLASQMIHILFSKFFHPAAIRFECIYSSTLSLSVEERLKNAVALTFCQLGWPIAVIRCILNLDFGYVPHLPEGVLSAVDQMDDVNSYCTGFESNLTKDAVVSWRSNFSLSPDRVFLDAEYGEKPDKFSTWRPIREAVIKGGPSLVAKSLSEAIDRMTENRTFLTEASENLVLLGIDLKDDELTHLGLKNLDNKIAYPDEKSQEACRIYTTAALGYASLGDIDKAIHLLKRLPSSDKKYIPLLGFAGSLFAMKGQPQEASRLFTLALRLRPTPMSWPVKALAELNPELEKVIKAIVRHGELPRFLDASSASDINEAIVNQFPAWSSNSVLISSLEEDVKEVKGRQKHRKVAEPSRASESEDDTVSKSKLCSDLWKLLECLQEITEAEEQLASAQRDREWSSVQSLAVQLDQLWDESKEELTNFIDHPVISEECRKIVSVQKILDGEKAPPILQKALLSINSFFMEMSEQKKGEFESEKVAFQTRLKNLNMGHLWPNQDLTPDVFNDVKSKLMPQIIRSEKLEKVERGSVTLPDFALYFQDELERKSIVRGILNKVVDGSLQLPKNLGDLICSLEWDTSGASEILHDFVSALKRTFSEIVVDDELMVTLVLPVIVKLSSALSLPPLQIVIQYPVLGEAFNRLLVQSQDEDVRETVSTVFSDKAKVLVSCLIDWTVDFDNHQTAQELLLKWLDFDQNITPTTEIEVLSLWLDARMSSTFSQVDELDILCFCRLRDGLIHENRIVEAALLASALWRTIGESRILDGFETSLYDLLAQLVSKDRVSASFAHDILENPGWIISQKDGVILYLNLCYLGNFIDLVERARFQFFSDFEAAEKQYPVLVGQFLLDADSNEVATQSGSYYCSEADVVRAFRSLEEFNHALTKTSCFKKWPPASDYQRLFNTKLVEIRENIIRLQKRDIEEVVQSLSSIGPDTLIEDVDRELDLKAKSPGKVQMVRYLENQLSRLCCLLDVKKKIGDQDLLVFLHSTREPLMQRLQNEMSKLRNVPERVLEVYQNILESIK